MLTTHIVKVHYLNREGQKREWWFRGDTSQPANSSATLAIDPPVTLCLDPMAEAQKVIGRAESNGWSALRIEEVGK